MRNSTGPHSFGRDLEAARKLNGLSIQQVSNVLRIRCSILSAIEQGNFEGMPAKGFARNQISAYARFLGLDPAEIVNRFLIEYSDYERMSAISDPYTNETQRLQIDHSIKRSNDELAASSRRSNVRRDSNSKSSKKRNNDDSFQKSKSNYDENRKTRDYRAKSKDGSLKNQTRKSGKKIGSEFTSRGHTPYKRGLLSKFGLTPLKIILLIAALALLILFIFVIPRCVCGSSTATAAGQDQSNGQSVPVSGVADNQMDVLTDNTASVEGENVSVVPQSFEIEVTVPQGVKTNIQVLLDEETPFEQEVTGPWTQTFTAKMNAKVSSGNGYDVIVKCNSTQVPLKQDDGVYRVVLTLFDGKVVSG